MQSRGTVYRKEKIFTLRRRGRTVHIFRYSEQTEISSTGVYSSVPECTGMHHTDKTQDIVPGLLCPSRIRPPFPFGPRKKRPRRCQIHQPRPGATTDPGYRPHITPRVSTVDPQTRSLRLTHQFFLNSEATASTLAFASPKSIRVFSL